MNRYAVYALGNPLIDIEFRVSEAQLRSWGFEKGTMRLISQAQHDQLLLALDQASHHKACGGSAANTVHALGLLGASVYYSGCVGDDAWGDFFIDAFNRKGIDHSLALSRVHGITGKCIVLLTEDAQRTMQTFIGVADSLAVQHVQSEKIGAAQWIYVEGYLVAAPSTYAAACYANQSARQQAIPVALALSDINMVRFFKPQLLGLCTPPVDLLFCNYEEAALFCETDSLETIKQRLTQYAARFVVTLGKEGSLIFDGIRYYHAPSAPVHAIDTLGAGDNFAGGFLYALSQGYSYEKANNIANDVAGRVVTKLGPRIDEIDSTIILQHINRP